MPFALAAVRSAKNLAVAAATFAALSVAAPSADAGHCRHGDCRPAAKTVYKTKYRYNDVQQVRHVTKYRDVYKVHNVTRYQDVVRPNYVDVVHRTVDVTRVHPVTRVNVVTRVHPVMRVNTVTRVRNVTVYRHRHEVVGHTVVMDGRAVHAREGMMMPVRMDRGGLRAVYRDGRVRNINCNC
jgi:hypothetical protein